jgi:hypothetical protein
VTTRDGDICRKRILLFGKSLHIIGILIMVMNRRDLVTGQKGMTTMRTSGRGLGIRKSGGTRFRKLQGIEASFQMKLTHSIGQDRTKIEKERTSLSESGRGPERRTPRLNGAGLAVVFTEDEGPEISKTSMTNAEGPERERRKLSSENGKGPEDETKKTSTSAQGEGIETTAQISLSDEALRQ